MRARRLTLVAVLAAALVFASVPMALARGGGHGWGRRPAPYRVSKPSVPSQRVVMGVSFESTGVVIPPIAADDTSTTVVIKVYTPGKHGRLVSVSTVDAVLSPAADATATVYDAFVTLPSAGKYALVAVVMRDGSPLATSAPRPVTAVLPYKVSRPRLVSHRVDEGTSFDATGVVTPALGADDPSSLAILVYKVGRHGRLSLVATAAASFTGPVDEGTGYAASLMLPTAGKYVLVAVLSNADVVVGRSAGVQMRAKRVPVVEPVPDPEPTPDPAPDPAPDPVPDMGTVLGYHGGHR